MPRKRPLMMGGRPARGRLSPPRSGLEAGLRYVYMGNVLGGEDTFCPACGHLLIRRSGCSILEKHIQPDSRCPDCSTPVTGVGIKGTFGK
jgi:hypothetical protein